MCLSYVHDTPEDPLAEGVGYKVMSRAFQDDRWFYRGEYYSHDAKGYLPGEEYERKIFSVPTMLCAGGGAYPVGFHIFKDLKSAKFWLGDEDPDYSHWRIVKVIWRHRLADGVQQLDLGFRLDTPVVVAKYMTIVEEVSKASDATETEDSANPDQCKSC